MEHLRPGQMECLQRDLQVQHHGWRKEDHQNLGNQDIQEDQCDQVECLRCEYQFKHFASVHPVDPELLIQQKQSHPLRLEPEGKYIPSAGRRGIH